MPVRLNCNCNLAQKELLSTFSMLNMCRLLLTSGVSLLILVFQSFEALLSLFQKPRNKKRPFIDKRNERTTTFALLHRSQKDPLAADSDAPQMVLHQHPDVIKRKEEEREHGVFFEDDYDYLQHLKDRLVSC
jgi:hypothetical protein